jgi:hypothetical protein
MKCPSHRISEAGRPELPVRRPKEHDDNEVLRLMSIAVYWERLTDLDDWRRDGSPSEATTTRPA